MPLTLPAASSPPVKRSESPGRKNPMSSPHSAKTMTRSPISPKVLIRCSGLRKPPTAEHGTDHSCAPSVHGCPPGASYGVAVTTATALWVPELEAVLGAGGVLTDPAVTASYARDQAMLAEA